MLQNNIFEVEAKFSLMYLDLNYKLIKSCKSIILEIITKYIKLTYNKAEYKVNQVWLIRLSLSNQSKKTSMKISISNIIFFLT